MKYIIKGTEPQSFIDWKTASGPYASIPWSDFLNPVKSDVHEALLYNQGSICCYCQIRIGKKFSHIEHIRPQTDSATRYEYTNMLASCEGGAPDSRPRELHCGHAKGNWFDEPLMVSALEPGCESFFKYTLSGDIYAVEDPGKEKAASETIKRLGLNITKLRRSRQEAFEGITQAIDSLNENEIRQLIVAFENRNADGFFGEFCAAIVSILRQFI